MAIAGETAELVGRRYLAGASAQEIARELDVSAPRVLKFLEQRGVKRTKSEVGSLAYAPLRKPKPAMEPARPYRKWRPELEPEVLARYSAGESGGAIAKFLGVAPSSVYRVLRERGVLRTRSETRLMLQRGPSRPGPERKDPAPEVREIMPAALAEEVLKRYAAGEAPRLIALVLGVPGNRVYRLLRDRDLLRSVGEALALRAARRRAAEEPPERK